MRRAPQTGHGPPSDRPTRTEFAAHRWGRLWGDLLGRTGVSFCLAEVRARAGEPLDFRFVQTNVAFEARPRLAGVKGRWARTALPGLGQEVYEVLRDVVVTGEAAELERRDDLTGWRPLKLHACRLGSPWKKLVGVLLVGVAPGATARRAQ